jgi:Fe2+ or Zn2+ uptake regulation protein
MNVTEKNNFATLLRQSGHKVTERRLSLLQVLAKADKPLAITDIIIELKSAMNQATIYRAVEALADVGILRRVDMQHAHTHYELALGGKHHHHLICKNCGKVEDVERCDVLAIEKNVLKKSKFFAQISDHSLEFFGFCTKCAKVVHI